MPRILYYDEVPEPLEPVLRAQVPEGFELLLWDRVLEGERRDVLAAADYILVGPRTVDAGFIAGATSARLLQKIGAGTDNIDLAAAARRGLAVANTPGGNAAAVAELTILMILALYRKLRLVEAAVRAGRWPAWEHRPSSFELQAKVHGIVGLGAVGQEVARRSRAFGADVRYVDIADRDDVAARLGVTSRPLGDLLRESDVVSLHVPLTEESRHLVGRDELAVMKPSALLINVARGGVVDESALYAALRDGRLAGAGIDVWQREPPAPDDPLLRMDNVVATPHVGAGTRDTYQRVLAMAVENIRRVATGAPARHVVTPVSNEGK